MRPGVAEKLVKDIARARATCFECPDWKQDACAQGMLRVLAAAELGLSAGRLNRLGLLCEAWMRAESDDCR